MIIKNRELHQFYEVRRKELKKRIKGNQGMPKYRYKECGTVWYGQRSITILDRPKIWLSSV